MKQPTRPTPSLLLGVLLTAFLLPTGANAEVDALVREAAALNERGQPKQAFDLLAAQETKRAGDPDFDLTLGIAANMSGDHTRAIFALERVLAVQPENARARAELGRALFAVGDTQAARTLLQQTKDQNIPAEAAKTVDQFLQAIDRVEEAGRSSVRGFVEFGIGHDSNANSGPSSSNVAVPAFGGLVLALNPGGVETSSSFTSLAGGISGRYVIDPRWSLIGSVTGQWRMHSGDADQFDTRQLDLSAGAAYRVERNEYSLALQTGTYGVDNTTARRQTGVVGEWTYRIDGFRQVSSYLQYARLEYPSQSIRDADRTVLGSSYAHQFSNGLITFAGGYLGSEDERAAGVPQLGHKFWGARAGVQKAFGENLAAFVTAGYEDRKFNGQDPLFLATRHDKQTTLNLGMTWIPGKFWRVMPQISFTSVDSNIPINDYDKRVFSVNVRREF